jgi:hypothetical protein
VLALCGCFQTWSVNESRPRVLDANGQALAYIYARETRAEADIAKVLTFDEARRNRGEQSRLVTQDRQHAATALRD